MQRDEWVRDWCYPLMHGRSVESRIPAAARDFLVSFGLPRVMVFEWLSSFEISFTQLEKELVPYSATIGWGDFYDEKLDRAWNHQLVIGEQEFCNGHASFCIHQHHGTVSRLDCELSEPECFVNSNVELFGRCLLVAQNWSTTVHAGGAMPTAESLLTLMSRLKSFDPRAFEVEAGFWPTFLQCVLENPDGDPFDLQITSDPARSKSRF